MSKNINHDESFEWDGQWSFEISERNEPHKSKQIDLLGTLTYEASKKELILKIISPDPDGSAWRLDPHADSGIGVIAGMVGNKRVYLYECRLIGRSGNPFTLSRLSFSCSLLVQETSTSHVEVQATSWKKLQFRHAQVEYKNLSLWAGKRQMESNFSDVPKEGKDTLYIQLPTKERKEKMSESLTYRECIEVHSDFRKEGIYGYVTPYAHSYIDLDFGEQRADLETMLRDITLLESLLHFSMLPQLSAYVVSIKVKDKDGNSYALLSPTKWIPKREMGVKNHHPADYCFIPARLLGKVGACFEYYKENKTVRSLISWVISPSYTMGGGVSNTETMYVQMYTAIEIMQELIIEKQGGKEKKIKTGLFIKDLIGKLCKFADSEGVNKEWKDSLSEFRNEKMAVGIANLRNSLVHSGRRLEDSNVRHLVNGIDIMVECLVYQIKKHVFGLNETELVNSYASWIEINCCYPFWNRVRIKKPHSG